MALPIAFGSYDTDPDNYYMDKQSGLWKAVEIALQLGRPLLLTGEPGTGKTQLANYAARQLSKEDYPIPFIDKPFIFRCKTTSVSRDLFYYYDAVSHFQDKTKLSDVAHFISLTAMGLAILQTIGKENIQPETQHTTSGHMMPSLQNLSNIAKLFSKPKSSVVLIDEIDKAPRDFPNDLLNELENNEFIISEMNKTIEASSDVNARILVILTSNNEKSLPDAFLRRCIYYHVPFPDIDTLAAILKKKVTPFLKYQEALIYNNNAEDNHWKAVEYFIDARSKSLQKLPATSELIDWIKILYLNDFFKEGLDFKNLTEQQKGILRKSFNTLFKSEADLELMKNIL